MDKDSVIERIIKEGYNASNINGVVTIYLTKKEYDEGIKPAQIRTLLKDIGYKASWGINTRDNSEHDKESGFRRDEEDAPVIYEAEQRQSGLPMSDADKNEKSAVSEALVIKEDGQYSLF